MAYNTFYFSSSHYLRVDLSYGGTILFIHLRDSTAPFSPSLRKWELPVGDEDSYLSYSKAGELLADIIEEIGTEAAIPANSNSTTVQTSLHTFLSLFLLANKPRPEPVPPIVSVYEYRDYFAGVPAVATIISVDGVIARITFAAGGQTPVDLPEFNDFVGGDPLPENTYPFNRTL